MALEALASKLSGEGQLEGQSPTDIAGAGQRDADENLSGS